MVDENEHDVVSAEELKVLAAFGRKVNVATIAEMQGVTQDFVQDTISRWSAGDLATARRVVAEHRERPSASAAAVPTPAVAELASTPAGPEEVALSPFKGDLNVLLDQARQDPALAEEAQGIYDQLTRLAFRFTVTKTELSSLVEQYRKLLETRLHRLSSPKLFADDVREWATKSGVALARDKAVPMTVFVDYLRHMVGTTDTFFTDLADKILNGEGDGDG